MYGLVNEGFRELVIQLSGIGMWEEICQEAGIQPEGFEPLCPYHDSLTYKLVELTSQKLRLPANDLLTRYGYYWITYTAESGYGEIMRLFGSDFHSCLMNLNRMHANMGAMMPQLSPPRFTVESPNAQHILVHYYSHRPGLAPMVLGLLQGLADKYGNTVEIEHTPKGQRSDHDEFLVRFMTS